MRALAGRCLEGGKSLERITQDNDGAKTGKVRELPVKA
jgi:hypothetical protein